LNAELDVAGARLFGAIPLRRNDRSAYVITCGGKVDSREHRDGRGRYGDSAADPDLLAEGTSSLLTHIRTPERRPEFVMGRGQVSRVLYPSFL